MIWEGKEWGWTEELGFSLVKKAEKQQQTVRKGTEMQSGRQIQKHRLRTSGAEIRVSLPNMIPTFSVQYLMTLWECCEGYMTIIFPNIEVGSGMLGRGQGHTKSDTGNDRESCFPVQPSLSQDTLQSPCLFPRFQNTEMEWPCSNELECWNCPLFFPFSVTRKKREEDYWTLNFLINHNVGKCHF